MKTTTISPTLKIGSRDPAVIELQKFLNDRFGHHPIGGVISHLDDPWLT